MMTFTRLLAPVCVLLLGLFWSGCASSVGMAPEASALASTEIETSSKALISSEIKTAFQGRGFSLMKDGGNVIDFVQQGGRATTALYGSSWNTDKVMIEPQVKIEEVAIDKYLVSVDVYMREYVKGSARTPWRVHKNGRRHYSALLKEVKERVEAQN